MAEELICIPESLVLALKEGKVVPFVGAGISRAIQNSK
jgi:hypothetical protein